MLRVHALLMALAGLWLLGDTPTQAQGLFRPRRAPSRDSHEPLPGLLDRRAAEDLLARQLRQTGADRAQFNSDLNNVAQLLGDILDKPERYGLSKKKLEQLAEEVGKRPGDFGIDLNDPRTQELARKLAGQVQQLPPEQRERLEAMR